MALQPLFVCPWQWGSPHLTGWPVSFLLCSTGVALVTGPLGSQVAPVLPSEAEEPIQQILRNLLAAHPCKYLIRLEWSTSGKSGRPKGQDAVLPTSFYNGHVSSLFSWVHMQLNVSWDFKTFIWPSSSYLILLLDLFKAENKSLLLFLLHFTVLVEKPPWSCSFCLKWGW